MTTKTVALVGGRGYTGGELLKLIAGHPHMELAFATSSSQAGLPVQEACPDWPDPATRFTALDPAGVAGERADAWVLAVPNGAASEWAGAIVSSHPGAVVLDLSADHRFSTAWVYGLPERNRDSIAGARRIANPSCYATGAQLGLLPLREDLAAAPSVFGISGYSGAGKTPSPRNDPERLKDNLLPYKLAGHVHEQEVSHQLDRDVRFMPHVADFFRGISLTLSLALERPVDEGQLLAHYEDWYQDEPRVRVQADPPEVADVRETPDVHIGGFTVDERDARRVSLVVTLDNLSKGAASQAVQNLNLALGLDEHEGLGA